MAHQDADTISNPSSNEHFSDILAHYQASRREVLQGLGGAALLSFLGGSLLGSRNATAAPIPADVNFGGIGFEGISVSQEDTVRVPSGYSVNVLAPWGDPISDGPAFRQDASNSAEDQLQQFGMHSDAVEFFPFTGTDGKPSHSHGLLCINHEYTDDGLLHVNGTEDWSEAKVFKSQYAHGVSVIEVQKDAAGAWRVVRPSPYARRITARTDIEISGPVALHAAVRTADDPAGKTVLGTLNNCAGGRTPWGTYLTCEENFNGYFINPGSISTEQRRYGVSAAGFGYRWDEFDTRFRADRHPNEVNRFGWVTEIDPFRPDAQPKKRTAMGRIKHEGAMVTLAQDGRVVVYMGDDERNEYIYKFVSRQAYNASNREANFDLLDEGTLYVAKFSANGTGTWLELTQGKNGLTASNGFADQAEVLLKTRQAADRAGATMMDRPEWVAVHPTTKEVYITLTNNSNRGGSPASSNSSAGTTSAGSARPPVDAANPRARNVFGHIIRWVEASGDPAATQFAWSIFVLAGDPANTDPNKQGNIQGDAFGSPDGLWFDYFGRLWIQTDVSTSVLNTGDYKNLGNNQMLCADWRTGEIRRFLTGPKGCEITGSTSTLDGTSMFISIQHPGEPASERNDPANPKAVSSWPDGANGGRPRSATIVIQRNDGGVVGGL